MGPHLTFGAPSPLQGAQPMPSYVALTACASLNGIDSNRPQPLWQPPATACLTASVVPFLHTRTRLRNPCQTPQTYDDGKEPAVPSGTRHHNPHSRGCDPGTGGGGGAMPCVTRGGNGGLGIPARQGYSWRVHTILGLGLGPSGGAEWLRTPRRRGSLRWGKRWPEGVGQAAPSWARSALGGSGGVGPGCIRSVREASHRRSSRTLAGPLARLTGGAGAVAVGTEGRC